MPEPQDLLGRMYADWMVEMTAYPDMSDRLLRYVFGDWERATAEPEGVTYASRIRGGVPGIAVTPLESTAEETFIWMHGGGFALGSASTHRKLAGHVAKALGTHGFVVDFRLAPEHRHPAQIEDGLAVYDAMIESGTKPENITFIGDSAGGNLALAMALKLREQGKALPRGIVVMSPWLNMENNGKTLVTNNDTDFLIAPEGLQGNIDRYLGDSISKTHPLTNPLYADLTGLPPLYICASDAESLYDNAIGLRDLAERAGVDVTFSVGEGEQHVYPLQAGNHARADEEVRRVAEWYRRVRAS